MGGKFREAERAQRVRGAAGPSLGDPCVFAALLSLDSRPRRGTGGGGGADARDKGRDCRAAAGGSASPITRWAPLGSVGTVGKQQRTRPVAVFSPD